MQADQGLRLPNTSHVVVEAGKTLRYSGFFYLPGHVAGIDSAREFLTRLGQTSIEDASPQVMGRFVAHITNADSAIDHIFVDNAGMQPVYYGECGVSTSMRDLALRSRTRRPTPDTEALLEFLIFSYVPNDRTLCDGIKRLGGDQVLVVRDGQIRVLKKRRPPLNDPGVEPPRSLDESFRALAHATSRNILGIDLTGGMDSRFLAAYLAHFGCEFETGISARPDHEDVKLGRAVALALGRPFFLTPPPDYRSVDLLALYESADASTGALEAIARKSALQRDRRVRGVDLAFDGTGGELYKDFWWLQDFPLYSRKTADLHRLYNLRIEPVRLSESILSSDAAAAVQGVRTRNLEQMEHAVGRTNTEKYDAIYYQRMRGTSSLLNAATDAATGLTTYSPLLEYERVSFGYRLPRNLRAFDRFERREISRLESSIARIPTTRGVTAESGILASVRMSFGYVSNLAKRAASKGTQRALGRRLIPIQEPGSTVAFAQLLMQSPLYLSAVAALQETGVLRSDVASTDIPPATAMRLFVAGRFVEELGTFD